jgi:hypothetical protein
LIGIKIIYYRAWLVSLEFFNDLLSPGFCYVLLQIY